MFDPNKAHEIDNNGLMIEGGPHIIGGAASPLSINPVVPTVYVQSNGVIWTHQGSGSWVQVGNVDNFSYHKIDKEVTLPNGQQMITEGCLEITPNGSFVIEPEGEFILKKGDI